MQARQGRGQNRQIQPPQLQRWENTHMFVLSDWFNWRFAAFFFIYDGQSKGAISSQTLKNTHLHIGIQNVISDRDSDLPVLE